VPGHARLAGLTHALLYSACDCPDVALSVFSPLHIRGLVVVCWHVAELSE
jgi:hypothetical protein